MGMYTELVLGVELSKETPKEVIDILKFMTGEPINDSDLNKEVLNSHPFFSCDRWTMLLRCDSYYFDGQTHSEIKYDDISKTYFLTSRSNLKNYDNEIDMFLNWIDNYVTTNGTWGYKRYEEDELPTIIFKDEGYKLKLLQSGNTIKESYEIDLLQEVKYNINTWNSKEENEKWNKWIEILEKQ